jgi:thiamine pyrophosphokinase
MKKTLIVAGGDVDISHLDKCIKENLYDEIIAVDGGLTSVDLIGYKPDIIIGDFDTVDKKLLDKYASAVILKLNPVKDNTDTEEAVDYAISHNATSVDIIGALGGRLDHTIGNIFLLKKAYELNVSARVLSPQNEAFIIYNYAKVYSKGYKYVSLIQFDGSAKGVTLKGFKYNVEDFDFDTSKTYRLGISNEIENEYAEVFIKEGYMLCILSKDN